MSTSHSQQPLGGGPSLRWKTGVCVGFIPKKVASLNLWVAKLTFSPPTDPVDLRPTQILIAPASSECHTAASDLCSAWVPSSTLTQRGASCQELEGPLPDLSTPGHSSCHSESNHRILCHLSVLLSPQSLRWWLFWPPDTAGLSQYWITLDPTLREA